MPLAKAVFIDRDGTINRDVPYCSRPEDFELLAGVGEGIRRLNRQGYLVIVVTNQSGIARGYFSREMLEKIHLKMQEDLKACGARVDAIYYCPHHPDEKCDCRKPQPRMIIEAAREHRIDLSRSYIIGDKEKDVEAGQKAGLKKGLRVDPVAAADGPAEGVFATFIEAVEWLLDDER